MGLIKQFWVAWPRSAENLEEMEDAAGHKPGPYVLYHWAMPVYIGRGAIHARLLSHAKEGSKKEQFRDRFSWFVVGNTKRERELESLLLAVLRAQPEQADRKVVQKIASWGAEQRSARPGAASAAPGRRGSRRRSSH